MGVSTDAKLIYGFEVGEEEGDEAHERCKLLMDEEYDRLTKAEKTLGAELVYHCSDGPCPLTAFCTKTGGPAHALHKNPVSREKTSHAGKGGAS